MPQKARKRGSLSLYGWRDIGIGTDVPVEKVGGIGMSDQEYEPGDELGWKTIFGAFVFIITLIIVVLA